MKKQSLYFVLILFILAIVAAQCMNEEFSDQSAETMSLKKGKPDPTVEAGNNLSYPVIWSDGVAKALPGTVGVTNLSGVWWYQWGTNGVDPDIFPASCPPDPEESDTTLNPMVLPYCNDYTDSSLTVVAGEPVADNPLPLARAYLQKDPKNLWQAGSDNWDASPVDIHWVDWGDNLESVDWYTRSQVRTEVVLFEDLTEPMLEYQMRHTDGWGIDEVHGLATDLNGVPLLGEGTRSTVYSHCARLTIQKILVAEDSPLLDSLIWVPGEGWIEPNDTIGDIIGDHIFNGSVHEGGDGPGFYSAEINVKGRIIYGYTWNVRQLNDDTPVDGSLIRTPAGVYRITFSFDENSGTKLNTFFTEGVTQILIPLEEAVEAEIMLAESEESGDEGGGTAVMDYENNLTYIDVTILERGGGENKGGRK
ncbi:hypothetical protein [Maribellus luteus]|nr:hypothetical protein [Maribellus luteus]